MLDKQGADANKTAPENVLKPQAQDAAKDASNSKETASSSKGSLSNSAPPQRFKHRRLLTALALAVLLGFMAVFALFCLTKISVSLFGHIPLSQILFHIRVGGGEEGITGPMVLVAVKWGGIFLIGSGIVALLVWFVWRGRSSFESLRLLFQSIARTLNKPVVLLVVVSSVAVFFMARWINQELQIASYLSQPESTFVAENFAWLDTESKLHQSQKRNLIVLVLESMEQGYGNAEVYGENLIPELLELQKQGLSFSGYERTAGSFFTMDGLAAQLLGVPLVRLGFDIHNMNNRFDVLLRRPPSLFNLLQNLGYNTAWFSGVTEKFTQKGEFFRIHGFSHRFAKEHWLRSGWPLNTENRGTWDFNDEFLFARLVDWLTAVDQSEPFAVLFETVDTHAPQGFTKPQNVKFGDARDTFRVTSRQVGDFIGWARQQPWWNDTTIVIIGDHPWQDSPVDFTRNFTQKSAERQIFNVFLNTAHNIGAGERRQVPGGFSAVDVAPTILDAMGIRYEAKMHAGGDAVHDRLGLGISLFSGRYTLVGVYGRDHFWQELNKRNDFYDELF